MGRITVVGEVFQNCATLQDRLEMTARDMATSIHQVLIKIDAWQTNQSRALSAHAHELTNQQQRRKTLAASTQRNYVSNEETRTKAEQSHGRHHVVGQSNLTGRNQLQDAMMEQGRLQTFPGRRMVLRKQETLRLQHQIPQLQLDQEKGPPVKDMHVGPTNQVRIKLETAPSQSTMPPESPPPRTLAR